MLVSRSEFSSVTPQVHLRNPLHVLDEAHKQKIHSGIKTQGRPEVQNRGISGPTKMTDVLKKCLFYPLELNTLWNNFSSVFRLSNSLATVAVMSPSKTVRVSSIPISVLTTSIVTI